MRYIVIVENLQNIAGAVDAQLEEGWRLYGDPMIYMVNNIPKMAQALIKGGDESVEPTQDEKEKNHGETE